MGKIPIAWFQTTVLEDPDQSKTVEPYQTVTDQPGINNPGNWPSAVFQQASCPDLTIWMHGYAVRAIYKIPVPQLWAVGGAPLTPIRQYFDQRNVAVWNGAPIYYAEWELEYHVRDLPTGGLEIPVNPVTGVAV